MKKIYELKNQRAVLLNEAKKALGSKDKDTYHAKMAEVQNLNADIEAQEALDAEEGRFSDNDPWMTGLHQTKQREKEERELNNKLDTARSGREYANAWGKAISARLPVDDVLGNEAFKPLHNAMTIGGGTPAGSEGGFLVPIEFDNMIHTKMKEFIRLADLFNVENVGGYTGWRAVETTASRTSLPKVEEAADIPKNDKPTFKKVTYTVAKYGDRIAVSSELLNDNTAGLMQYLANWFGPRLVMTENELLLGLLSSLTAKAFTAGNEVAEIKAVLNKSLNTAISKNAALLCNQSSYDALDQMVDANGRAMLVPNPADPDVYRFKGRPVVFADNDLIPDRTVTSGTEKGDYYPMYIGYFKAYGTLFRRQALEFASTNIGGDAWATSTTEVRGIVRMDAQKIDEAAAQKREIFVAGT